MDEIVVAVLLQSDLAIGDHVLTAFFENKLAFVTSYPLSAGAVLAEVRTKNRLPSTTA